MYCTLHVEQLFRHCCVHAHGLYLWHHLLSDTGTARRQRYSLLCTNSYQWGQGPWLLPLAIALTSGVGRTLGHCHWKGWSGQQGTWLACQLWLAHLEQGDHDGMGSFAQLEEGAQTCRGAKEESVVHVLGNVLHVL